MNSLSGFNSQEIRRLHPYLSALLRRIKDIETGRIEIRIDGGGGGGGNIVWGTDDDIVPTGNNNSGGSLNKVARADHQHLFKFPTTTPASTPDGSAYFDPSASAIKVYISNTATTKVVAGATTADVQPTGTKETGTAPRYAFADHSHPTAILPQGDSQTPVADEIRYNTNNKIVRWNGTAWVEMSVETVEAGTDGDVQPTRLQSAGSSSRFARADHSHPTALLPQSDTQTPVVDEIRYDTNDKLVRWNGTAWVPLSVETFTIDYGTNADVQPTRLKETGSSTRVARADHSHPTAILPQSDSQTPVADEIRYNSNNKIVRWNGSNWVEMSVETVEAGTNSDVQPTKLQSAGSSSRFARADHSHPTAILPQSDSQTPVVDEIRYTGTNQLVRWNGSAWVNFAGSLPVPADPLVLPYDNQVSSPQNRQLVNHSSWDNIGNATIFYRDSNNAQYRLAFARPLVVAISSTPSGKDVWVSKANELVLKFQSGDPYGATGVLWSRGGNTSVWSPVATQLLEDATNFIPSDVGVLSRSALTGTSGSRRWFLKGAQEGGSFRAPFAGIATFTASNTPAHGDLATNLNDGYAYFISDFDRVDIVKPETDGNKYCTMLSHYIISPPCRIFSTATDPSGHYIVDEFWNNIWVISYYTTNSATSDLVATLPTTALPFGIRGGRALLYLHNPQSSSITTVFRITVRTPTSTSTSSASTPDTSISIPANTTVLVNLGHFNFSPSSSLSHHRSYLLAVQIIRRKSQESANANKVICFGVAIVPQRAS
jgi:hypothetical protein